MSQYTLERYAELFQRIRKNSKTSFHGIQLECITKLVFFGGVQRQQIPELRIRDVFDGNGKALDKITKFKKPIILSEDMKRALEDYFKELKSRRSSLANRTSYLFPGFRNANMLRRHWEKFGTSYTQIKRDREVYKKEEKQRRYEKNMAELQKRYENGQVDMIVDIDDDRWN